ncbi:major facilitator superfamily domain-containing protein [Dichotomocladium elegans]|nr:major facilitator superfamily domain-containing protein [Dichotomocladium elegans]
MWDTFAPCLYIFVNYYFGHVDVVTVNAINAMSLVYMLLYPFAIQTTLRYFEDSKEPCKGLKRGVLIGTILNVLGAAIRWFGGAPNHFWILSVGQTVAALGILIMLGLQCIAQVFILSVPPRLAGEWFPDSEINLVTSIGVSANNLGVAAGCVWSPLAIKAKTMGRDIPRLLFLQGTLYAFLFFLFDDPQLILALVVLFFVYVAFQKRPNTIRATPREGDAYNQAKGLWTETSFYYMLVSYGIIMGAQCTVITLLSQILMPSFGDVITENYVGWLGFAMLLAGFPASCIIGHYLDRTLNYRYVCNTLAILFALSAAGLYIAIELGTPFGVALHFSMKNQLLMLLSLTTIAIAPALFQYASELYYPIDENIPTGYLFSTGNICGVLLVTVMGWSEDMSTKFSMRFPLLGLVAVAFTSVFFMALVKGPLKRADAANSICNRLPL